MGVIQIRVDDKLKADVNKVFEDMGIDMSTAIRMFLKRCVIGNYLPFSSWPLTEDDIEYIKWRGDKQKREDSNPNRNMTLEEINRIIDEVREEKMKTK